jgi:hypothetical protein
MPLPRSSFGLPQLSLSQSLAMCRENALSESWFVLHRRWRVSGRPYCFREVGRHTDPKRYLEIPPSANVLTRPARNQRREPLFPRAA